LLRGSLRKGDLPLSGGSDFNFFPGDVTPRQRIPVNQRDMQITIDASMIHLKPQVAAISELDDIDSLVAAYWPRVLRYVTFSIGDPDLAQTITQDCFLKAYNGRDSFRGECAVSTWLITIANNLIRDQVRIKKFQFWRKARATALDVTELASFLPSDESSPETRMLARERTEQVRAALDELSVNQRRVFLLKFFEDLTLEEIASATGMPVNTVKTHLYRGVTTIRATLGRGE
jgi:RNA polymerase sigma-70 factor (ECF subfamily)